MNIDPELIEAIALWLDKNDYLVDTSAVNVDACEFHKPTPAQVHALLLALAKCEPVRGLVEAAQLLAVQADIETGDRGSSTLIDLRIKQALAALAPFAEVE